MTDTFYLDGYGSLWRLRGGTRTKVTKTAEDLVPASSLEALKAENERYRAALVLIARGQGIYGVQSLEYKDIARKALGLPKVADVAKCPVAPLAQGGD